MSRSNRGRLYRWPQIYEETDHLRSVLSTIRTLACDLGKVFKAMLSIIIQSTAVHKDSFATVKELKSLTKSTPEYKMISFHIASLSTKIIYMIVKVNHQQYENLTWSKRWHLQRKLLIFSSIVKYFGERHLPSFKDLDIIYWKCYADDTFVSIDSKVSRKGIRLLLLLYHPSL